MKSNIFVCGLLPKFMDSLGRILAGQLDMYYMNTTDLLQFDLSPRTPEEVLASDKEIGYREKEAGTVRYASTFYNTLIVSDSGVVKNVQAMKKIKENCFVVFVSFAPLFIKKSLHLDKYPSKVVKKFYDISTIEISRRANIMKKLADFKVTGTAKSEFKISSEIIRLFKENL